MDELKAVFAETLQLPLAAVSEQASTDTVPEWDSLAHLRLIMKIEQRFRIKFTMDEVQEMIDLPTIWQLIEKKASPPDGRTKA